ncbi:type II toxin-antitoxin system ParD family antitoxin [Paenibacillus alvei]|uniref:ribbon-helix-helix domain-containing protein n=1 Tax=Paenibacillus alvei TaxID=44250 RepID=UPI002282365C|nr:hypothetical protein [Paenibacillus alvei]MCY7487898.1 hypothetical protein [Paenibacillus alvei]
MTKKDFMKKIAFLRKLKKDCLRLAGDKTLPKDFRDEASSYAKKVPANNKDLVWSNDDPEKFMSVYDALYAEYSLIVDKFKAVAFTKEEKIKETEIKEEKNEFEEEMKKEVEIKGEEETNKTSKKKESKIKDDGQVKMSFRGGFREGAGRPSLGIKKPVSITLEHYEWHEIDDLIQNGEYKSYSDFFRTLLRKSIKRG